MIRVLVIDDHPVVRAGLEAVVRSEPGLIAVGSAARPRDAIELIRRTRPDVALVDARLGEYDGIALVRSILREPAPPAVLVVSGNVDSGLERVAVEAGAHGAVDKGTALPELFDAIRLAARGAAPDGSTPPGNAAAAAGDVSPDGAA